jgi:hypothetical protein
MKRILIATTICALVVVVFAVSSKASRTSASTQDQSQSVEDRLAIRDALRRGGVREAARLKGKYVAEHDPHWDFGLFTIEALTKNSAAVFVGHVKKKLGARIPGIRLIFTEYEVIIDELMKGNVKQGQSIVVLLPGGKIEFEDGTSAEQTTPTFEHIHTGRTYAFFLTEEAAVPSVFFLFGGPQGVFDLQDGSSVKSHGRPDDPGAVEAKGMNCEQFLEHVRKQALKWPKPGKCCG